MKYDIENFLEDIYLLPINEHNNKINECLGSITNLSDFIMPISKSYWKTAAEVIQVIGGKSFEIYIDELLIWLQDMNWPGAREIAIVISEMDRKTVIEAVEKILKAAKKEKDYMWIAGINKVCTKMNISRNEFRDSSTYEILELADF